MLILKRYHLSEEKKISDVMKYSNIGEISDLVTKKPYKHIYYDLDGRWLPSYQDLYSLSIDKAKSIDNETDMFLASFSTGKNKTETGYIIFNKIEEIRDAIICFSKHKHTFESEALEGDEDILFEYDNFYANNYFDDDNFHINKDKSDSDESGSYESGSDEKESGSDESESGSDKSDESDTTENVIDKLYEWSPTINRSHCFLKFQACSKFELNDPFTLFKNGDMLMIKYDKKRNFSEKLNLYFNDEKNSPYLPLQWGIISEKINDVKYQP